jgi:hypothetical protein
MGKLTEILKLIEYKIPDNLHPDDFCQSTAIINEGAY